MFKIKPALIIEPVHILSTNRCEQPEFVCEVWAEFNAQWSEAKQSLTCGFCLSVAARTHVHADASLRYTAHVSDSTLIAHSDRFVGLVVKASAPKTADLGFDFRLRRASHLFGSNHTSDTPVTSFQALVL